MARSAPSKPVGPVDIEKVLADARAAREAGKNGQRTRTVTVYTRPEAADEANQRLAEIEFLEAKGLSKTGSIARSVTEPDPDAERLAQLEAEYDALVEEFDASELPVTFRDAKLGDFDAIQKALADAGRAGTNEDLMIFSIAQYAISPKLTPEQVEELMNVIGSAQLGKLAQGYQALLGGAPLLRRR
jgi:hypothetical protein